MLNRNGYPNITTSHTQIYSVGSVGSVFKSIFHRYFLGLIPGGKILTLVLKESHIGRDLRRGCRGHPCWSPMVGYSPRFERRVV